MIYIYMHTLLFIKLNRHLHIACQDQDKTKWDIHGFSTEDNK
jgi:hypothetical protein